jgi:hypothetical protein
MRASLDQRPLSKADAASRPPRPWLATGEDGGRATNRAARGTSLRQSPARSMRAAAVRFAVVVPKSLGRDSLSSRNAGLTTSMWIPVIMNAHSGRVPPASASPRCLFASHASQPDDRQQPATPSRSTTSATACGSAGWTLGPWATTAASRRAPRYQYAGSQELGVRPDLSGIAMDDSRNPVPWI